MMQNMFAIALFAATIAGAGRGEVIDTAPSGFTVREIATITAPPDRVWDALGRVGAWWDPAHSYSHDPARLSLTLQPGGEWRESLPDGGVRHMVVVNAQPGKLLRLEGALGPLQGFGVVGHLTLELKQVGAGTQVIQTYDAGGHAPGGLDKLAAPVDGVLAAQLGRLKRYVETGSPAQ